LWFAAECLQIKAPWQPTAEVGKYDADGNKRRKISFATSNLDTRKSTGLQTHRAENKRSNTGYARK